MSVSTIILVISSIVLDAALVLMFVYFVNRIDLDRRRALRENQKLRRVIGLDECGDCEKCGDDGDDDCPFYGEPDGCNNRFCRAVYLKLLRMP